MGTFDTVVYKGITYRRYPDAADPKTRNYYRATTNPRRYLHRVVFEDHHGPVPAGHHVHHRDGDTTNNSPANLVALLPADHVLTHYATPALRERRTPNTPEHHAALGRANLLVPEYPTTCHRCGHTFTTSSPTATYCSTRCRVAAHRARRTTT